MYQWQVGKIDFDAKKIEEFCSAQIEQHREDRKKYVW
jgi:hypothetical protein